MGALKLAAAFKARFNVTTICAGLDHQPGLCEFAIDTGLKPGFAYAHPFVGPELAFYVPTDRFTDTVPWMMQNRGSYDVLVHPNSDGCPVEDHANFSFWMGTKWELNTATLGGRL